MSNREEKEKAWREEFMNYFSSSGNRHPKSIMESYLAGRKAGQEEIDRLSDVITISNRHNDDQYAKKNEIILALENRLEEKKEEVESKKSLFLSMSKKQRDDKDLIDRLRANHEEFARKMGDEIHVRNNHVRELKASNEQLRAENEKLKDLVTKAKPIIAGCVVEVGDIESQWLKDSEVIGE